MVQAGQLNQREQIRKESEAEAGSFTLTVQDGRMDTTGNLFDQPTDIDARTSLDSTTQRERALRAALDQFFQTVQTKEDDAANVAMFNRNTETKATSDARID